MIDDVGRAYRPDVQDLARIITDTTGSTLSTPDVFTLARTILDRYQAPAPKRPRFVVEASDKFAVETILYYLNVCGRHGLTDQAGQVARAIDEIRAWQRAHPDDVHFPDHPHQPWQPPADAHAVAGPELVHLPQPDS